METVNNRKLLESYLQKHGISALFQHCKPHFYLLHYAPGELLTNPFTPSTYFQFVVDGELLLYNMPDESSINTLVTSYNEIFTLGDIELLDADFVPFFVEAKTEVYSVALYLDQYKDALLNEPAFLRRLCLSLAKKLTGATEAANQTNLKERVRRSLKRTEPGQTITNISHLAKSLNVSNRQLLRVLKNFCSDGILVHEKKGVYRVLKTPE